MKPLHRPSSRFVIRVINRLRDRLLIRLGGRLGNRLVVQLWHWLNCRVGRRVLVRSAR